jgi:hypothetical protein
MLRLCSERSRSYPGRSVRLCDHLLMVAPHVVMHEVIGQKSAEGIVVDSLLMKRRPEAKRENSPLCSILSMSRPVHVRVLRRDDGNGIFKVNQNGSFWFACPTTVRHSW